MSAPTSALDSKRELRFLRPVIWIVVTALVASLPFIGISQAWSRQIIIVMIFSMLAIGLNLNLGWAGELNMGLPAMFAAGAYVSAYVSTKVVNDLLLCLVLAGLAALVVGLAAGAPGLRLGGWMLAVCTFLLVLLIPTTLQLLPHDLLGGTSGFTGIPLPNLFGIALGNPGFYAAVIVVCSLWFAVYRSAVKSQFGNSLLILQHGSVLAPSLGIQRYRLKLTTYALASIPMGMAGALFAFNDRFVSPTSMGLHLIITILVASIVAGRRSIFAIIIGVAFVQLITTQSTQFGEFGDVAFGAFLIVGGLLFGGGISGLFAKVIRRIQRRRKPVAETEIDHPTEIPDVPALQGKDITLTDVSKVFGGVNAVSDVSLSAKAGQITALIGPNGSGKTTTLNMINGFLRSSGGRITLGDKDITGLPAASIAKLGVTRTFQTPAVPIQLSVVDVVASGRIQSHKVSLLSTILRLPSYNRVARENRRLALDWLRILGLSRIAYEPAAEMSLGTRRMIELARALCANPSVVLLDEVASGLDRDEVTELASVLRAVAAAGATVILVEHNFGLVQSLAQHVVVLAEGSVLTDGPPSLIAEHPDVLERFLGTGAGVSGTTLSTDVTASSGSTQGANA